MEENTMKTVKDKYLVVGADFAGYPLKEAVCKHLREKGWKILDLGVTDPNVEDTENMFHRVGLRVGSKISEGEYERALLFCGTGMGIHIAASKCPHVHAGVVESVPAALRAITGNGVNVLAMGAFYVAPQMGCDIADAYLNAELGSGYEWWHNFYEFHKLAIDELEAFNYEEYKKNGFKMKHLGDYPLKLETKPEDKTRYDFYIRNKKTNDIIYIEHKDRNYRSDQFPDWQLDGKKYNYLKQTYKRVYYINTFTDGKYAIWDLNAPIGEWRVSQPHKRFSVLNSQMIQTKDIYFKLNNALFLGSYEN